MLIGFSKKLNDELWFKSQMNQRQFHALSSKLNYAEIENEVINNKYWQNAVLSRTASQSTIGSFLNNAWNTEKILESNNLIIDGTSNSFALQWAFPQAYYSVFGTLLAMFNALGYTETSHTGVLKKFGTLLVEKKLPESISFYCHGEINNIQFYNIDKPADKRPFEFNARDIGSIDNHICQFLKSTREIKLRDKAPDFKFRNIKGGQLKKLTALHWNKVSDSIGNTTIMDLLYRKRIKANYQDIDTFTYSGFNGRDVLNNLQNIVNRLNLVNELYIAKAIGREKYNRICIAYLENGLHSSVQKRVDTINALL